LAEASKTVAVLAATIALQDTSCGQGAVATTSVGCGAQNVPAGVKIRGGLVRNH
jgi:hypothetical protein